MPTAFSPLGRLRCPHKKKKVFKGRNASATALRLFTSDTARIVFIHISSVVKSVHIFKAKNRVSESFLIEYLFSHLNLLKREF